LFQEEHKTTLRMEEKKPCEFPPSWSRK
jgi:hypothetical protein